MALAASISSAHSQQAPPAETPPELRAARIVIPATDTDGTKLPIAFSVECRREDSGDQSLIVGVGFTVKVATRESARVYYQIGDAKLRSDDFEVQSDGKYLALPGERLLPVARALTHADTVLLLPEIGSGGLPRFLKFAITEPPVLTAFIHRCWPGFDRVPDTVDPRVAATLLGRAAPYVRALRAALGAAGFSAGAGGATGDGEAEPALYAALQAYAAAKGAQEARPEGSADDAETLADILAADEAIPAELRRALE